MFELLNGELYIVLMKSLICLKWIFIFSFLKYSLKISSNPILKSSSDFELVAINFILSINSLSIGFSGKLISLFLILCIDNNQIFNKTQFIEILIKMT